MTKKHAISLYIALIVCAAAHAYRIQEIPSPNPTTASDYGWSSATDGQTLVVGAKGENGDAGAVYVYERDGLNWNYTDRLDPNSLDPTDEDFGYSVAVEGDTIVVGAKGYNSGQGAVYVFVKDSVHGWDVHPARFTEGDGSLGRSVAIDNNTIVVGCPYENYYQGAVYVYERLLNGWSFKQKLEDADGKGSDDQVGVSIDGDRLGYSVAIDGDIIVAGAYYDVVGSNNRQGSVCVFRRSGGTWFQPTSEKLAASNGQMRDWFGYDVEISGDWMTVGTPYHDNGDLVSRGCIYMLRWNGSQWIEESAIVKPGAYVSYSFFGLSLSLEGNRLVSGDYKSGGYLGSAFLFEWDGNAWSSGTSLVSGGSDDRAGSSVVISGETFFVGVYGADVDGLEDAGMVYALTNCNYQLAGDLNDDCRVDILDLATLSSNWLLDCFTDPTNPSCIQKP